jgi:hypothetical protein
MVVSCFTGRRNEHRIPGYSLIFTEMLTQWPGLKPEVPKRLGSKKSADFICYLAHVGRKQDCGESAAFINSGFCCIQGGIFVVPRL